MMTDGNYPNHGDHSVMYGNIQIQIINHYVGSNISIVLYSKIIKKDIP